MTPGETGRLEPAQIARDAAALVHRWRADLPAPAPGERPSLASSGETVGSRHLGDVLRDDDGERFAVELIDAASRTEALFGAGYALARLGRRVPQGLSRAERLMLRAGGVLGPVVPGVVVPSIRAVVRHMVGHLLVDHRRLERELDAVVQRTGARLDLAVQSGVVLGPRRASLTVERALDLLSRDEVGAVSLPVASVVAQADLWAFEATVTAAVDALAPLFDFAAAHPSPKHITLEVTEYAHVELAAAIFKRLLSAEQRHRLEAGIVLQAHLPDALDLLHDLTEWAQARRAQGGAAITVRLTKGQNLSAERSVSELSGWPLAPYEQREQAEVNLLRILDWAVTAEHAHAVRVQLASHDVFAQAHLRVLAQRRGVESRVGGIMASGAADGWAEAMAATGDLMLRVPVVFGGAMSDATAELVRHVHERARPGGSLTVAAGGDDVALAEQHRRFLAAVETLLHGEGPRGLAPLPHRVQDRGQERINAETAAFTKAAPRSTGAAGLTNAVLGIERGSTPTPDIAPSRFANEADSDPTREVNRRWASRLAARAATSTRGADQVEAHTVTTRDQLDETMVRTRSAAHRHGRLDAAERGRRVRQVAAAFAERREHLIETMVSELGCTVADADADVTALIDLARYAAARAREVDAVQGAAFSPSPLSLLTSRSAVSIVPLADLLLGALAAGGAVLVIPPPHLARTSAVLLESVWHGGIDPELAAFGVVADALTDDLLTHDAVTRMLLVGPHSYAAQVRAWRPDLPMLLRAPGKNSIIVTPEADLDRAAADIVRSGFSHAGQRVGAASLVVLVGAVGRAGHFEDQLVDAVEAIRVGEGCDPSSHMGRLARPADSVLERALTTLEHKESWLVAPQFDPSEPRVVTPGVRTGVRSGSFFHTAEFVGPVIGLMRARSLREAIALANAVPALTAGLQSHSPEELAEWVDTIGAGGLFVNRPIVGAKAGRQPLGAGLQTRLGDGRQSGGAHMLVDFGRWHPDSGRSSQSLHLRGLDERVSLFIEAAQPAMAYEEFDYVRRSALSDAIAWAGLFDQITDIPGLDAERNLVRYRPVPAVIRAGEGAATRDLVRVLAAAVLARADVSVSAPYPLPDRVGEILRHSGVSVTAETDAEWLERLEAEGVEVDGRPAGRLRVLERTEPAPAAPTAAVSPDGVPRSRRARRALEASTPLGVRAADALAADQQAALYTDPVTPSGRVELLPFLAEQSIAITAHRHGLPDPFSDDVL